jgi:hypothetical protein
MRARQRGATFLGMVVIIAILGFGLYAGIRLTPLYFEYMAIARAMEQTATEHKGNAISPQVLRTSLDRRWTIEDIKSIQPKDIQMKKAREGYTMRAAYEARAPFVANISLVVAFDKSVLVPQ